MQKDPYVVLGVARDATQDQIERAYIELRDRYQSERFAEGAAGAHAARMLAEIEDAYNACMEDRLRDVHVSGGGGSYGDILQAIKENRLERAQEMLDGIEHRDAEWHYYQAAIYHKRNWNVESQNNWTSRSRSILPMRSISKPKTICAASWRRARSSKADRRRARGTVVPTTARLRRSAMPMLAAIPVPR